ncbi:MAG: CocE/NonD family hydrolase [Pseudomonadota bacterium]
MLETIKTIRAAWPMLKRAIGSGQLFRPQCRLVEPSPDIHCQYDVAVPIGTGTVMTANVFRSRARMEVGEADPVVMCAHPYDNHKTPALKRTPLGGPPQQYRLIPQAGGVPEFSTLASWEAPDPNLWVPAGYTLVNLNLPGYANAKGEAGLMSQRQGEDYYAGIKWVAEQDWCDGNVGLSGVSYLAISQYHAAVAAFDDGDASPLKCIAPWEGLSDLYRDLACRGGVEDRTFLSFWWHTEVKETLNNPAVDLIAREGALPPDLLDLHPLFDAYWADKAVDFSKIRTPLLVCGSFSDHELHTPGSIRAFETAASPRKWLYTHRTGKWVSYYSSEVTALLLDFMSHHLKGERNRFDTLEPVRLEVRKSRDEIHEVRFEAGWPLPETEFRKLYLTEAGLSEEPSKVAAETAYAADDSAVFDLTFTEDIEISGPMVLCLWCEVRPGADGQQPDDMILCCYVDKRDRGGASVRFNGSAGQTEDMVTRGYIRVSRRALDPSHSTDWCPVLRGDMVQPLSSGEIVPVKIALCPSSTLFSAGERLRLIISPRDLVHAPIFGKDTAPNTGLHVLHMGGDRNAHLLVPVINREGRGRK